MKGATVVAGASGLGKPVRAVSVLESAHAAEHLTSDIVLGDEIIITAFISAPTDVELQCEIVRILHAGGESGLILFYVGIFMPEIPKKLIDLADELGFPIICMEKNRVDIPYSEVIREIMELIIRRKFRSNAWRGNPEQEAEAELVQVLLDDDRLGLHRMERRFGQISMSSMRVLIREDDGDIDEAEGRRFLQIVRDYYMKQGKRVFAALYDGALVALFPSDFSKSSEETELKLLDSIGKPVLFARIDALTGTDDLRSMYELSRRVLPSASRIFARKRVFNRHDLGFADNVLRIIGAGKETLQPYRAILGNLKDYDSRHSAELCTTLETLLLDANMSTSETADLLYLHPHTIQYRIRKIKQLLGHDVFKVSAQFELATACAIGRLIRSGDGG
jgi:sugar diacid utilization regulator